MTWRRNACVLVLVLTACARSGMETISIREDFDDEGTWGGYAATLDVPECPDDFVLTVNTTADELDGGDSITSVASAGPRLSFAEAMWINVNRGGGGTILFDAGVFPARAPGTIDVSEAQRLPSLTSPDMSVCVDARHRGVVLRWPEDSFQRAFVWSFGAGSQVVGLTLLYGPMGLYHDSVVAGCRIGTDGHRTLLGPVVYSGLVRQGTFGPGNVVSSSGRWGLTLAGDGTRVVGNSFGCDPLTGAGLQPVSAFDLWPSAAGEHYLFDGNTFAGAPTALNNSSASNVQLDVRGNFFGVDALGHPLPAFESGALPMGLVVTGNVIATVGSDNVFRGLDTAVYMEDATVRLTRNVISGNQVGIARWGGLGALIAPPDVTDVRADGVSGTCPGAGDVEVFSDPADQGETYLGAAACGSGAPYAFSLTTAVPSGRFVTAIYTDSSGQSSGFSTPRPVPFGP